MNEEDIIIIIRNYFSCWWCELSWKRSYVLRIACDKSSKQAKPAIGQYEFHASATFDGSLNRPPTIFCNCSRRNTVYGLFNKK